MSPRYKRRRLLIQPRVQLRIVLAFVCAACVSTLVQALLLSHSLSSLAETLPTEGNQVLEELPGILRNQVLLTFLLMAPLMLAVGVLETFRIVGPLYRIEQYLREMATGKKPGPCRIRSGDELQELCNLLNDATQPLLHGTQATRSETAETGSSGGTEPPSLVERQATSQKASQRDG